MSISKIIREPGVLHLIGCSSQTLRRMEKRGDFPKRRKIGARAVGWLESEVCDWIAKRQIVLSEPSNEGGDHNDNRK